MTETENTANGAGESKPKRRWGKRLLVGALLVGIGGVVGFAGGVGSAPAIFYYGIKHHKFDAERITARVDRRVEKVLSRVDATAEQKQQVSEIAKSAVNDLAALGFKPWEMRGKVVELLGAETIDPAAFEAMRAEQIGKMDVASKRAVQAITDAAVVLTPEQRRELMERWQRRHSH